MSNNNRFRHASGRYQQNLLQSKHDSIEKQVEAELIKKYQEQKEHDQKQKQKQQQQQKRRKRNYDDQDQDTITEQDRDDLLKEIERVKQQIKISQGQVNDLKSELNKWQHKQSDDQTPQELTPADLDFVVEYLLEMGQMPLDENAAGLDQREFPETTPSMKTKAMEHPDVVAQRNFSNMTFTKLENTYVNTGRVSYRQCHLEGSAYNIPFTMTFNVDATLEITSLDFDVGANLKVDANTLLSRIKQECNLMALFRLILHYGQLEIAKKKTFDYLKQYYEGTKVDTHWDDESSTMTFSTRDNQMKVKLAWSNDEINASQYNMLDVDICGYVKPSVQFTAINACPSAKLSLLLDKVPENFNTLSDQVGVIQATKLMIGSILQERLQ